MSKERLEDAKFLIDYEKRKIPPELYDCIDFLIEQAERVQELEQEKEEWLRGRFMSVKHSISFKELEQENEILRAANDDLNKELRILKNCKEVDVDHPSNKFF